MQCNYESETIRANSKCHHGSSLPQQSPFQSSPQAAPRHGFLSHSQSSQRFYHHGKWPAEIPPLGGAAAAPHLDFPHPVLSSLFDFAAITFFSGFFNGAKKNFFWQILSSQSGGAIWSHDWYQSAVAKRYQIFKITSILWSLNIDEYIRPVTLHPVVMLTCFNDLYCFVLAPCTLSHHSSELLLRNKNWMQNGADSFCRLYFLDLHSAQFGLAAWRQNKDPKVQQMACGLQHVC